MSRASLALRWKTLEELEGVVLSPPDFDSYLARTVHRLHKKPIGEFSIEDLRVMIGQGQGLPFLVPLALDELERNPFAEGDMYEGDLLQAALSVAPDFWRSHRAELERVSQVVSRSLNDLASLDTTDEIRSDLRAAGERLLKLRSEGSPQ